MDFFLAICLFLLIGFLYTTYSRPKYPPGPFPYPFVGNSSLIKNLSKKHNGFHNALTVMSEAYKSDILSLKMGKESLIIVQSEELLNQVCMRDEFQGRPDNFFLRLRSMGRRAGITMTDGQFWSIQRTFAMKHLHDLGLGKRRMDEMIQKQLQDLLPTLKKGNFNSVKLRQHFSKCVLNVLWEIITGESFANNERMLEDLILFMEERAKAFDISGGLLAQFPFLRFICPKYSGFQLIQKLNDKFRRMILTVINEHKNTYSPHITRDFIDAFLHEINKNNFTFTEEQLIMVCLDYFIAGSQTTSSTLDFLLLHMVLYPKIQVNVQNELDEILKHSAVPSSIDKLKCHYTEAVILECHRLSAVVPVIGPRRVIQNTYLAGYAIPKETTVLLNLGPFNRDHNKWEDPNSMKPERFLDENYKIITDQKLFSFGKGKRRCPGEALAKNFIFIFFSGILFHYKLQVQDENNPPSLKTVPGITLSPAEYSIKMVRRFPRCS